MAGIYIHIPFCKRKCNYCNFFSVASLKKAKGFSQSLIQELDLRRGFPGDATIETLYFGGGTPSMLQVRDILNIIEFIQHHYNLSEHPEISLEANPDDLSIEYLSALSDTPVNRLSIGIQSFQEQDLRYLDRIHGKEQGLACIENAQKAGFNNLSIDFIYGIPGQSDALWKSNLQIAASLNIPHVSAYWLTVEARTALNSYIEKGKLEAPDENAGIRHFHILREWASANGYEHYEISNLCKHGHYARHNTSYWQSVPYLGIGPSAHSFDGKVRYSNVASIEAYKTGVAAGNPVMSSEILSREDHFNEYLMTRLRTQWGVDTDFMNRQFGPEETSEFLERIQEFIHQELVVQQQSRFTLSESGMLLSDHIISRLFIV